MLLHSNILLAIKATAILFMAVLLPCANATAIGIIVPREKNVAAPLLQSVDVSADVTDNIARTRITQVYKNNEGRPVEADFYFPVPDGADITDFVLYMDGKPVRGEVLGKDEAQDIYRDIVRKLKDPGLVEWADKNLFRVRIFPIPAHGEQKLEIELSQALTADQGYYRYYLPMESGRHPAHSSAAATMKLAVSLTGDSPVRNVYSPTHKIDTTSSSSKTITVTATGDLQAQQKDFILYYELSDKNIALSLLTHKTTGNDGFFTLRISPPWDDQSTTAPASQAGDYVFVIDTSGSMAEGDKIAQARKALRYCVGLLNENDRFSLIRFSTTIEPYQPDLMPGTAVNRAAATEWIENLKARGGTNISEALKTAMNLRGDDEKPAGATQTTETKTRMFTVVFLTDGLPTVGQTAPDAILKSVAAQSGGNVRIFTFGVGNDVNTRLLDSLADETRAASDYVAPDADLEVPVSRFFDKVSRPALFNLELKIPAAGVTEVYPAQLPDLFYGTELAVFGKYKTAGESPIILTGTLAGEKKEFRFEKVFPETSKENPFVEKLWATRKVAWLLDQVRKSGESDELRKEIEELARKYAIVTPYTSYLAMEDKKREPQATAGAPAKRAGGREMLYFAPASAAPAGDVNQGSFAAATPPPMLRSESGAGAVQTARRLSQMKSADALPGLAQPEVSETGQKNINGKIFELQNGVWVDTAITGSETESVKIKYLSEAWFQLSEDFPQIREILSLGEQIRAKMGNGTILETGPTGTESIEVKQLQLLGLEPLQEN